MSSEDDLRTRSLPSRLWGFLRSPAVSTALVFGLFFLVFGVLESRYLERKSRSEMQSELRASADEMVGPITLDPVWNLDEFRRYPFSASDFLLCSSSGLLLEVSGMGSLLVPTVTIPSEAFSELPTTIRSEIGEEWRVLLRKVKDGYILVGTRSQSDLKEADAQLGRQSLRLGSDLSTAGAKGRRETEVYVDFAVVGDGGQLLADEGGLPLRTDPGFLERSLGRDVPYRINGRLLLVEGRRLVGTGGQARGVLLLPRDVDATERMLREQKSFVAWSLLALWVLSELFFVIRFRIRYRWPSLERALREGETDRVEFKGSFKLDAGNTQRDYIKSIAGFLNSKGGTLFVGVDDAGRVCGLELDLGRYEGSSDRLMQAVLSSISSALGKSAMSLLDARFEPAGGRLVCRFDVKPAPDLVFVHDKDGLRSPLWVRIGNMTQPLSAEEAVRYSRAGRRGQGFFAH
ncbi:MAG: helix-turn-helix domain-containing protein [Thermoanaerobaculia bacterium]